MVLAPAGSLIVWGIFSWHTLGPLLPNEHRLNAKAYLSIFADHVHPSISTVDHLLMAPFSRGWCCGALLDVVKREICIINVQQAGVKCA